MSETVVAIVVLNWNNASDTLACLESLGRLETHGFSAVVVDNGSTDDSAIMIHQAFPGAILLETGDNLGYAGGNNVGIRYALAQGAHYVCILNNDATVASDFLDHLLLACRSTEDVGVSCPMICEEARPDTIWALGMALNWRDGSALRLHAGELASTFADSSTLKVEAASGTAMLVNAEVFRQVGMFDEKFYLYYEEVDWCVRVRQAGFEIVAAPQARVWHKVSASLNHSSPVIDYYMLRNHLLFAARHTRDLQRLLVLGRILRRDLAAIAAYTVKDHGGERRPHRNARLLALRDAALGRWGKMGPDVAKVCCANQ